MTKLAGRQQLEGVGMTRTAVESRVLVMGAAVGGFYYLRLTDLSHSATLNVRTLTWAWIRLDFLINLVALPSSAGIKWLLI